jgi:hypothetical protein
VHFGRSQRLLPGGHYNDIAAVTTIAIPMKKIGIYNDESGPSFCFYVGDKWERDRKQFMDSFNIHAKLDGKPKMYLKYTGGCDCRSTAGASFEAIGLLTAIIDKDAKRLSQMRHTHSGRRSPLLVHTNDLGRDYNPEGNEPRFFRTADVLEEFRQYLEKVVLKSIASSPIPENQVDISTPVAATPFSSLAILGELFTFGEWRDEERIRKGKENPDQLEMSDRYGMSGGGYRLMSLGTPNDGTVPEIAYDGFLWCGIAPTSVMVSIKDLDIPGHYCWSDREQYVIKIKPKKANDIYIADHALYEKRRKEIWETVEEGRERLSDAEVADFTRARARSIIPISKYRGGFEQPVVLINRELDLDEVEVVSGPHREKRIA